MINETSNKTLINQAASTVTVEKPKVEYSQEKTNVVAIESTQETAQSVENTVNRLNDIVQSIERDLNFRVDDNSGKTIITVLDTQTEEVIRQIPAEHVLALSENIESLKGILFSVEV